MKRLFISAVLLLLLGVVANVSAKKEPVPRMYMFGLAASFTDTIVHVTPIQTLDSVWIDSKSKFLEERHEYSIQLRSYLESQQQMPHRTCVVFYSQKKKDIEKKYEKIMRLYTKSKDGLRHFDVRMLPDSLFHFHTIDLAAYSEAAAPPAQPQADDANE